MKGGCSYGEVRYALRDTILITHACHCTWRQRETGAAFAINAVIETSKVDLLSGRPMEVMTPSLSGRGQVIVRCPTCCVAIWSHYPTAGKRAAFVRVGALDQPHDVRPDVHIFTSTKRPWAVLPEGAQAFAEFYNPADVWSGNMLARWGAMMVG